MALVDLDEAPPGLVGRIVHGAGDRGGARAARRARRGRCAPGIARVRNLLVHGYADVDDDRVIDILHGRLDDLASFRQHITSQV